MKIDKECNDNKEKLLKEYDLLIEKINDENDLSNKDRSKKIKLIKEEFDLKIKKEEDNIL